MYVTYTLEIFNPQEQLKRLNSALYLANLLIKINNNEYKINLNTSTKLADITVRIWFIPLYIDFLLHQKTKYMREHRICKENCGTLRATNI